MPQSVTRAVMANVSKHLYETKLNALGWKRKTPHLLKQSGDLFHCINFQASKWGSANDGRFTVNLIVTWPQVYECWVNKSFPANPATAAFPIQTRIGRLLPSKQDYWWEVSEQADLDAIVSEASAAVIKFGLPFFQQFPDTKTILNKLRAGKDLSGPYRKEIIHAIIAAGEGEAEEAKRILVQEFQRANSSPFQMTVLKIAERLGFDLS